MRREERLFALADQIESPLAQVRTVVEQLTPALPALAFRGAIILQERKE